MLVSFTRYALAWRPLRMWAWLFALLLTACTEDPVEPLLVGHVEGVVRDSRTNAPIPNVAISTNPASTSLTTDAAGQFSFRDLEIGKYALNVRRAGYRTETVNVTVSEGKATAVTVVLEQSTNNQRPNAPTKPFPGNTATNQDVNLKLKWKATDPDAGDSLRYDVVLYQSNSSQQQALLTNSRDTTVQVTGLKFSTTYFWQVTVRDKAGETVRGDVWTFTTKPMPELRYLFAREANGNTDVYASDGAADGVTIRLTSAASIETAPQLSPTRDRIAYVSNVTGQFQLYTMNRDGSDGRRITSIPLDGYHNTGNAYRWSPDGAHLIYAHYDRLYRINRDGTGLTLLATAPVGRHFREMDWSELQNEIMVQTIGSNVFDAEVYAYRANGTLLGMALGNLPGRTDSPCYSIDGKNWLYTRDVSGVNNVTGRQLDAHVFAARTDGSAVVDLSAKKAAGTNDLYPRYSPDGSKIIFVNVANDNITPPDVWIMDADGGNRKLLFQNATLPDWK
ncbi:beta-sandwich domain-containing protein [Hymenobacter latericus]|uniref:beta-sandwich domain-containing protein n=1 Tax=Hymenobacter sp. YIM 151858-1 TaxID=2987688 RepID=UPI0022260987|nr:DUF2012 domain-containing protein [Hymenobacter sp. YIM 151858-1]UYZ59616.1 DUF2012 domain-containing protein [Hymenobacter sp. YIM 151858-1]